MIFLPVAVLAAAIVFILIYGIEGEGNFLVFYAVIAGVFGFLFPRWWAVPYAGSLEFLYSTVERAGEHGDVYYTYNRLHWALVPALAAALGVALRLTWQRVRTTP